MVPFILACTLSAGLPVPGTDPGEDRDRTLAPHFAIDALPPAAGIDLPAQDLLFLSASRAEVHITGPVAEVRVYQTWVNESDQVLSGDYVFPASTRAAVHDLLMRIGPRTIRAEIKKRAEARRAYQKALAEGRTASLLEQERPNVFRTRVGHIQPGDVVDIEFEYSELLVPEEGVTRFVYPRVVGARYGGEFNPLRAEKSTSENPYVVDPQAGRSWSVDVLLKGALPVREVRSPTHVIQPQFRSAREAWVRLNAADAGPGDATDLVLEWRHADNAIAQGALLYRDKDHGENYFLMTLAPPPALPEDKIPPRELVFVVDVSGSMAGFPLQTVRATMTRLLHSLGAEDRFNLILFAGTQATFRHKSVPATRKHIAEALAFLNDSGAGGGTLLQDALDRAFALPAVGDGVARSFVLLSDGFIHADREVIHDIWSRRDQATLFAMGVGPSPNRFLMEGIARASGTAPFFVETEAQVAPTVARFARYASRPALTDIKLSFNGFDAYDLAPQHLGDLLADRPVVVMGKYRGPAAGQILVEARAGAETYHGVVEVEDHLEDEAHRTLRVLWARERVRELVDFLPESDEAEAEVTALGLEHRLLTDYTSFVAVDTAVRAASAEMTRPEKPDPNELQTGLGGLLGTSVGTTGGAGGLGLRGTGAGGGGHVLGTGGSGNGIGYGRGSGGIDLGGRGGARTKLKPAKVTYLGSLSREEIQRVITRVQSQVKHCYTARLSDTPDLAGKVVLAWSIGADGTVTGAKVSQSTLQDKRVADCVLKVVKRLQFPKPRGGGTVKVTYPWVFSPADQPAKSPPANKP